MNRSAAVPSRSAWQVGRAANKNYTSCTSKVLRLGTAALRQIQFDRQNRSEKMFCNKPIQMRQLTTITIARTWLILTILLCAICPTHAASPASLQIGTASKIINARIGDWVQAAGVARRATAIHDDLEANALFSFRRQDPAPVRQL